MINAFWIYPTACIAYFLGLLTWPLFRMVRDDETHSATREAMNCAHCIPSQNTKCPDRARCRGVL